MPARAVPRRTDGAKRATRLRMAGAALGGAGVVAAGFATLVRVRAVPPGSSNGLAIGWLIAAGVLLVAAAVCAVLGSTAPPGASRAVLASGAAGLCIALVVSGIAHGDQWRTIAGRPDNAPAAFYTASRVEQMLDRLVDYASGRPILGLYLSNHYESSVLVPAAASAPGTGDADASEGSGGSDGEIISLLPDGARQVLATKLSPGVASSAGLDPAELSGEVIAKIAHSVADEMRLGARDEIRVQAQRRNGIARYEVLARKDGADQPWRYFGLDGVPAG